MLSHFFIDRPIFATVLSVVIVIVGGVALLQLPIAQYPEVVPPTISVSTTYPGASAQVIADTVATPIEQQVNGVENMIYMSSRSSNDGSMTLDVTFKLGTDLNMAQVLVQNRVAIAESNLPDEVKRQGVTTKKRSPSILLCVNLVSPDGRYDQLYLSNYATIQIKDELARLKGVGDVSILGSRDYSMRVWLDPDKLATRGMTASDFVKSVREQNVQVAAGRIGQPPVPQGLNFQYTINTMGRLTSADQFAEVIVKTGAKGELVRVNDVVRDPQYRVRLDPAKLKKHGLTLKDVATAVQTVPFRPTAAAGASIVGLLDLPPGPLVVPGYMLPQDSAYLLVSQQDLQLAFKARSRGTSKQGLEEIVVKRSADGPVRLKDLTLVEIQEIKGVELGARSYDVNCYLDGKPSVALAVFQLPGSNAVGTAESIREKMQDLKKRFPAGVEYQIVYDTTVFIDESVESVYHTLFEAFVLVFVVVLLFLQDWRATILPMIEVPVSLVGTLAFMAVFRFSLNNLSLFGLVLAIGIVVDDAIVVIENVERWMGEGLSPRDATRKAMEETTGPIIAVAAVLCAVFIPTAFMAGISGQFYRQFALTIAASTVISAFNALTMTPARCALIMKPHTEGHSNKEAMPTWGVAGLLGLAFALFLTSSVARMAHIAKPVGYDASFFYLWAIRATLFVVGFAIGWPCTPAVNRGLGWFFERFNQAFDRTIGVYERSVRTVLRLSVIVLLVYGGLMALTYLGFATVPTGFIPEQDKGYLVVNAQLPEGASLERTEEVSTRMTQILQDTEGVAHVLSIPGYSVLTGTNTSNSGGMFVILKSFEERKGKPELSADAVTQSLRQKFNSILEAQVVVFGAPPVDGLGSTGGFKMQVQDRGGSDLQALQGAVDNVVQDGNRQPDLIGLFSSFEANQPQLFLEVDRSKVKAQGVALSDVFDTLQIYLGSQYVNDITLFNRNWQVNVQADATFRTRVEDIRKLYVRNDDGLMVPLSTLVSVKEVSGPSIVNHYNMFPSAEVNGGAQPGVSSGQAITRMEQVARDVLPPSMGYEWTDLTYQQVQAEDVLQNIKDGSLPPLLAFPLAVVFVFLALSAQYESWVLPLAVILIVPMCLLSAIAGVFIVGSDNNIFTQIGLVVLIGLAAKNAILIVEFAKARQEAGLSPIEATVEACRLRLRPIIMTSLAFILGVVPLVLAEGAGAEMRVALGVAVFSGMLGVTIFGIFFTPVFYVVLRWLSDGAAPMTEGKPLVRTTSRKSTQIRPKETDL